MWLQAGAGSGNQKPGFFGKAGLLQAAKVPGLLAK
jgi:hypothetical protein